MTWTRPRLLPSMRLKLVAAFASAGLVLVVAWVGIEAVGRTESAQRWLLHSIYVRQHVRDLVEALLEAQVAQTTYLAVGDTALLANARSLRERTSASYEALRALTLDNAAQQQRTLDLAPLLDKNVANSEAAIALASAGDRQGMLELVDKDRERVDFTRLKERLAAIGAAEDEHIEARRALTEDRIESTRVVLVTGGSLAFLLATFVIYRIRKNVVELERAHDTIATQAVELAARGERLERLVKELDQFAYVASHDLKAPLRAIASLASWIQEDAGDALGDEAREHLRLLTSRVARMEALVEGVLAYARAGRVPVAAESVDVDVLVRDVIELLAPGDGATVTIEGKLPTIVAARIPLQQVWMNLLSNALKHGKHEGLVVRLGMRMDGGEIQYYVADDGPGIDPKYHDRIFGLFQTLEARDRVEGTGIGLAVVKKLVEQHGGRIWLDSALGRGTTFFFTFPDATPPRAPGLRSARGPTLETPAVGPARAR